MYLLAILLNEKGLISSLNAALSNPPKFTFQWFLLPEPQGLPSIKSCLYPILLSSMSMFATGDA